jgi:hypothetical protein
MGKVYLLTNNNGFYKIGVTKGDIDRRIKSLQTGNPNKIELVNYYESNNYRKIESWFHRIYEDIRLEGEWFLLNEDHINNFLLEAENINNKVNALKNNPFF